jgi:hypothetical protein
MPDCLQFGRCVMLRCKFLDPNNLLLLIILNLIIILVCRIRFWNCDSRLVVAIYVQDINFNFKAILTITGAGTPAAILSCNAALGVCMKICAATFLLAPTP